MNEFELDDRTLAQLSQLTTIAPDPARAARTRAKCVARLTRRRGHELPIRRWFVRRVLAPVAVLAFCGFYFLSLVTTALRLLQLN